MAPQPTYPLQRRMPKPRNKFLTYLTEIAPPVFRERILPILENRVFPVLSRVPRPAMKVIALYVVLQVMLTQSTSVQKTWAATKRVTPRPVNRAFAAVGSTSIGSAAWEATLAIRSGANTVFRPLHDLHGRQKDRGQSAGEGIIQIKATIDSLGVNGQPAAPSVDELMKKIEEAGPAPSPVRR